MAGSEKTIGAVMILAGLIVTVVYAYLLFLLDDPELQFQVVKATIMLMVLAISGILIWIGYTLITTPPPKDVEEIEKEIEEEIRRLEKQLDEDKG